MFIVFEGIDGSGKSTLSNQVYQELKNRNLKVFLDHEPTTNSPVESKIKALLKRAQKPSFDLLYPLFLEDRRWHQQILRKQQKLCDVLILDRYFLSTMAYQQNEISFIQIWEDHSQFLLPDLIFYLDISVPEALLRIHKNRKQISYFEQEQTLNFILKNYRDAIRFTQDNLKVKTLILNACDPLESLVSFVLKELN